MGNYDEIWNYYANKVRFQEFFFFLKELVDGFYNQMHEIAKPLLEVFMPKYSKSYFNSLVNWHFKGGKSNEYYP